MGDSADRTTRHPPSDRSGLMDTFNSEHDTSASAERIGAGGGTRSQLRRVPVVLVLIVVGALVAFSCGSSGDDDSAQEAGNEEASTQSSDESEASDETDSTETDSTETDDSTEATDSDSSPEGDDGDDDGTASSSTSTSTSSTSSTTTTPTTSTTETTDPTTTTAATTPQETATPPTSAEPETDGATDTTSDSPTTTAPTTATTESAVAPPTGPASARCQAPPASVREKAARVVMVGVVPDGLSTIGADLLSRPDSPGGIFVAGDLTTSSAAALRALADDHKVLFAADEEGGRVQAIQNVNGELPSAETMAATLSPDEIRALAAARGEQLLAHGINYDLAPVVDIEQPDGDAIVGDRAFGDNPQDVIANAGAFAAGLRSVGVLPALKHFPGHGSASGDSHTNAVTTDPLEVLEARDIEPFRALTAQPRTTVMIGHLLVPGLTNDRPSSISPPAYRYLRNQVGFDGIIITDDLSSMRGVTQFGSAGEIGAMAFIAGADIVLYVNHADFDPVVDAIAAAVAEQPGLEDQLDASIQKISAAAGC